MDCRIHPMSAFFAALLAITPAAPVFVPPVERPITLTVSETRTLDGIESSFATTRRVVFHARDGGYVADVDTLSASGEAANSSSAIAEAGLSALIGRRMTITLDRAGQPVAVDDREALWTHVVDAIAGAIRRRNPGSASDSADPAPVAMLRSLSAERQLAMLASTLSPPDRSRGRSDADARVPPGHARDAGAGWSVDTARRHRTQRAGGGWTHPHHSRSERRLRRPSRHVPPDPARRSRHRPGARYPPDDRDRERRGHRPAGSHFLRDDRVE